VLSIATRSGYVWTVLTKVTRIMLLVVILPSGGLAGSSGHDLDYQKRGDRWEGIVAPKESGNDIELLSAIVDYEEPATAMPDSLAIRFFLSKPSPASLTVRGVRAQPHYWMKVLPPKQWKSGFFNEYRWATAEVIRKLDIANIYDLGAVVSLTQDLEVTDAVDVEVAPVILYGSKLPTSADGYRFTFKPITYEKLTCKIYEENSPQRGAIFSVARPDLRPGVPFDVVWPSSLANEGWYRLELKGVKSFSNQPVDKVVRFFNHKLVNK